MTIQGKRNLKILCTSDFSQGSKITLKTLKLLQKKYKTDTALIHVVESFWKDWFSSGLYQKEALQRLQTWQKEFAGSLKINKLFIKAGNPAENIIELSKKIKSDLILLGGKATEEFSRYKNGTTIESVVRSASKPVWICQTTKITKIICGIDGSTSSGKALGYAIDLCNRYRAKLCIIFALPRYLPAFGMSERAIQKEEEKFRLENTKKINTFLKAFNFKKIKHEIQIQWGIASNVILDWAEDFKFDLIVIGSKGHSKLHHVLIGSTAEKILRYAPCSLLVVR